jgi:hypothetical protein
MTVSGLTMTRTSVQRDQLRRSVVQKRPVQGVQFGPRPFAFEHGDLLSEGKDFEGCVSPTAQEDADDREDGEDELRHELTCNTSQHSLTMASPWKTQVAEFKRPWAFGYKHGADRPGFTPAAALPASKNKSE